MVNSTAQYAAVAALTGPQEHVTAMREEYRTKRRSCWTSSTAAPRCA